MKAAFRQVLQGVFEFCAVAVIAIASAFLVYLQVVSSSDMLGAMAENTLVEILQVVLLLASFALTALCSRRRRGLGGGYALVAGLFLCMAIRECDNAFDRAFFHGAWVPFALAAAATSIFFAAKDGKSIVPGLAAIATGRRFGILAISLAIVFFYARIFGMKQIWLHTYESIIGSENSSMLVRPVKNIAEEGLELFAYALITLWSAASAFFPEKGHGGAGQES